MDLHKGLYKVFIRWGSQNRSSDVYFEFLPNSQEAFFAGAVGLAAK